MIENLQQQDVELIEGIAVDDGAAAFLEDAGFWIHCLHEDREIDHFIEEPEPVYLAVWHNSSFSDLDGWQEWKTVYEEMIKYAMNDQTN